jgi:hypothetical protein
MPAPLTTVEGRADRKARQSPGSKPRASRRLPRAATGVVLDGCGSARPKVGALPESTAPSRIEAAIPRLGLSSACPADTISQQTVGDLTITY